MMQYVVQMSEINGISPPIPQHEHHSVSGRTFTRSYSKSPALSALYPFYRGLNRLQAQELKLHLRE